MIIKENISTEYKREYVDDIKKTIVAFANTNGGVLYVGLNDDGTPFGIENPAETATRITNAVRDNIRPDITLFIDYVIEKHEGVNILKVIVQRGTSCPYYLVNKGIRPEGVYIRHGASTVPATATAILRMIKDSDGEKYENARSLNQDLTFLDAEKEFKSRNISFGKAQKKTLNLLNSDGIFTNLALLISDQCVHTIKIAVFEDNTKAIFKDRREFGGSIFKQLNDAYQFIDIYNRTHSAINGLYRNDIRDYPTEAIREALNNALIHRDYSFSASTFINIFEDRIEFISIGGLVRGISYDDIMLGLSMTRNDGLANIFYRLKLIEAYGTGIPKILQSYDAYEIKPIITITDNAFKITLPNINTLKLCVKEAPEPLNINEETVMRLFEAQDHISRSDVEKVLELSQPMAVRILRKMTEKSLIYVVGKGKNTRYKLLV